MIENPHKTVKNVNYFLNIDDNNDYSYESIEYDLSQIWSWQKRLPHFVQNTDKLKQAYMLQKLGYIRQNWLLFWENHSFASLHKHSTIRNSKYKIFLNFAKKSWQSISKTMHDFSVGWRRKITCKIFINYYLSICFK